MYIRAIDPRTLLGVIRDVCAFFDGVVPKPTVLVGLRSGERIELQLTELSIAILEILDDYETFVLPQVFTSFRQASIDDLVE